MIVLRDPDLASSPLLDAAASRRRNRAARAGANSLRSVSRKAAQAAERDAILKALDETHWNRMRAAKLLNISYRSLLYKIKDGGLAGPRPKTPPSP